MARNKFPVFQQGTIIMVDFGNNRGAEFNYKHFAIVITSKDSKNSQTLQVLPLTSKNKHNRNLSLNFSVIHRIISNLIANYWNHLEILDIANKTEQVIRQTTQYDVYAKIYHPDLIDYVVKKNALLKIVENETLKQWLKEDRDKLDCISQKYENYNKQSFAKIESIREIDKSRILKKTNEFDPLNDIILPDKELNLLKKTIKKHFGL